jgi:hypothetical protein
MLLWRKKIASFFRHDAYSLTGYILEVPPWIVSPLRAENISSEQINEAVADLSSGRIHGQSIILYAYHGVP